jgi:hypothetical protein
MTEPTDPSDLGLVSKVLGGLPLINAVTDRLGLPALLASALPGGDARVKVSAAAHQAGRDEPGAGSGAALRLG